MKQKQVKPSDIKAKVPDEHMWTGHILQKYAEEMMLHPTNEEEIARIDMTGKFLKEVEREVMNSEILKIQINSKPRLGKSTTGIMLGMYIDSLLKKHFPNHCNGLPIGMRNVARDDQEWTRKMRNPDLMFDVIVTDEGNALEQTGENATTEQAQKEVFSDVQAGRYIHGIFICPDGDLDKNCDIKLRIRNREKGMIHAYLYYKLLGDWVFLGYVDLKVKVLISRWENTVKERFFRFLKDKTMKDKEYVDYWSKRDFYVEYMAKKYEKMELMNREGIIRPRELDYANITLTVVNKTKGLIKFMNLNQMKLPVSSYVEMEFKKQKIPLSLIGAEIATRRVMSVLTLYKSTEDLRAKYGDLLKKLGRGKINESQYNNSIVELKEHEEEISFYDKDTNARIRKI